VRVLVCQATFAAVREVEPQSRVLGMESCTLSGHLVTGKLERGTRVVVLVGDRPRELEEPGSGSGRAEAERLQDEADAGRGLPVLLAQALEVWDILGQVAGSLAGVAVCSAAR
jgi:hypothetical protein